MSFKIAVNPMQVRVTTVGRLHSYINYAASLIQVGYSTGMAAIEAAHTALLCASAQNPSSAHWCVPWVVFLLVPAHHKLRDVA